MFSLSQQIRKITDLMGIISLPEEWRQVTFYCEGKNYWPHLEGILHSVLESTDVKICYITSSLDDHGLSLKNERVKAFYIGDGFVRDYLFQNIKTRLMIMTTPDLHQYQVKRSKHAVNYVYVQHSLVSLHMIYRHGAFDHYDTICCAGPHHEQEVRALEAAYDLPTKEVWHHGYSRLDSLIRNSKSEPKPSQDGPTQVLIAPSWGAEGLIETGAGLGLVCDLLESGYEVTLRPHPQTHKFAKDKVDAILKEANNNPLFKFEGSVAGQESLHSSHMMISDWSGAALEYAFSLHKPVIFCDIPRKVNNPHYEEIDLVPLEVSIRDQIGVIWDGETKISDSVEKCLAMTSQIDDALISKYVFNIGQSDQKFTEMLKESL